jgi:hypothetical protein
MSLLGFFPPNLVENLSGAKIAEMLSQTKRKCDEKTPPPKLPENFHWKGTYVVPDLGIRVPLIWNGNKGNIQMIAGNESEPVFFTNLIFDGFLYTLTYKWPGVTDKPTCLRLFPFTLVDLNQLLSTSAFVGTEIIKDNGRHHDVNHFRFTVVFPPLPSGNHFRIAISEADIYVDRDDSTKFRKVLHFGYQNLLDPQLDEWIIINKLKDKPGEVVLPKCCPCSNNIKDKHTSHAN